MHAGRILCPWHISSCKRRRLRMHCMCRAATCCCMSATFGPWWFNQVGVNVCMYVGDMYIYTQSCAYVCSIWPLMMQSSEYECLYVRRQNVRICAKTCTSACTCVYTYMNMWLLGIMHLHVLIFIIFHGRLKPTYTGFHTHIYIYIYIYMHVFLHIYTSHMPCFCYIKPLVADPHVLNALSVSSSHTYACTYTHI
jgi:hypothetical protein